MIQLSESQYRRLRATQDKPAKAPRFRLTEAKLKLSEADVTSQITGLARSKGWKAIRLHSGLYRGYHHPESVISAGENSQADWLFVRPIGKNWPGYCEVFWLEVKAPGKRPSKAQLQWLESMRQAGFQAAWSDSLEAFEAWYCGRFS
jgi:hypothetical protein